MSVHIFRAGEQEATRFKVYLDFDKSPHIVRRKPRSLIFARCCRKKRWAKNCVVQVYYDDVYTFCKKGKGCKQK